MKLKDVNHFLEFIYVVAIVVLIVVLVIAARSDGWPCEPSDLQPKEIPLTRGPELPSSESVPFPGQIHVTLDRIGKLDCMWIFKSDANDWLPIGGKGCPVEEEEMKVLEPQGESSFFLESWEDSGLQEVFFPYTKDELKNINHMVIPGFSCVKKEDGFHCVRREK